MGSSHLKKNEARIYYLNTYSNSINELPPLLLLGPAPSNRKSWISTANGAEIIPRPISSSQPRWSTA